MMQHVIDRWSFAACSFLLEPITYGSCTLQRKVVGLDFPMGITFSTIDSFGAWSILKSGLRGSPFAMDNSHDLVLVADWTLNSPKFLPRSLESKTMLTLIHDYLTDGDRSRTATLKIVLPIPKYVISGHAYRADRTFLSLPLHTVLPCHQPFKRAMSSEWDHLVRNATSPPYNKQPV